MKKAIFAAMLVAWGPNLRSDEVDAIKSAIVHSAAQPEAERPFWRYVWNNPGTSDELTPQRVGFVVNLVCGFRQPAIVPIDQISAEVQAINLRLLRPTDPDVLVSAWDSLATLDPVFHIPGTLQDSETPVPILAPFMREAVAEDLTKQQPDKRFDVLLSSLASSPAPIMESGFLLDALTDSHYLAFRGVKVGDDLNDVLARSGFYFGSSLKDGGLRANFIIQSQITGDERVVVGMPGLAGGTATLTYDLFDETTDPQRQLMRNLEAFNKTEDGSEIFVPQANGMIEFLLADGDGAIVSEAPPNLASDHTLASYQADTQLRPAISCLACHTTANATGLYHPIQNNFALLPVQSDIDQRISTLALYGQDLDQVDGMIGRARRDMLNASRGFVGEEVDGFNLFVQDVVGMIRGRHYRAVTNEQATAELGFDPKTVAFPPGVPVDPVVSLIVDGRTVSRKQFDNVRIVLAEIHWSTKREKKAND